MIHVVNFQPCFADMVASGAKLHTIRPIRKRPIHPGDMLHLYTGLRTEQARLLLEAECLRVTPIELDIMGGRVYLGGRKEPLRLDIARELAQNDGFEGTYHMMGWFHDRYDMRRFCGHLIAWGGPGYLEE